MHLVSSRLDRKVMGLENLILNPVFVRTVLEIGELNTHRSIISSKNLIVSILLTK